MLWVGRFRLAAALATVAILATPAVPQPRGDVPLLARLEGGLWELRSRSDNMSIGSICLGDKALIAQPQHGTAPCSHVLIASDARSVTIHYTCPSAGFGRTVVRVETPRLAQIDSQGIHRNAPFGLRAEARRIGACRAPVGREGGRIRR